MTEPDAEPDWQTERFAGLLRCDEPACGEIVATSGNTTMIEDQDEQHGWFLTTVLQPKNLFPPPPMIDLPKEIPDNVAAELRISFGLYWIDLGACANRLRVSAEFLLDHFKIPREHLQKGKLVRSDLFTRIEAFEKQDAEHAMTLDALRVIGNLGSHGSNVNRDALLDAFEVYEDSLAELLGKRAEYLKGLKRKLIAMKSK